MSYKVKAVCGAPIRKTPSARSDEKASPAFLPCLSVSASDLHSVSAYRVARFVLLCVLLLGSGQTRPARAQVHPEEVSRAKLVAFNVTLTGTFAVGRRWAEGRLTNWEDALETFLYGGAGGYGFYRAKRLVGGRRPLTGLGLAYLSSSVVENTAQGRSPLSHLRLGAGPVDLRWRTPLAAPDRAGPRLAVEVNVLSALSFTLLPLFEWQPFFQNGMLYYKKRASTGSVLGRTFNRTVLLYEEAGLQSDVRAHEAIHVIQALQVGAVTPYYRLGTLWPGLNNRSASDLWGWDVQIDWLYTVLAPVTLFASYPDRWTEIEAHTLGHMERGRFVRREGAGPGR